MITLTRRMCGYVLIQLLVKMFLYLLSENDFVRLVSLSREFQSATDLYDGKMNITSGKRQRFSTVFVRMLAR